MNQLKKVERWKDWSPDIVNTLIDRINVLTKITGSKGIRAVTSLTGIHLSGKRGRIGKGDIAFAIRPRIAYCSAAAPAATTLMCYLDTDAIGAEITVIFSIAGGGNLNTAVPRLTDGLAIIVVKIGETWWCDTVFNKSQDCS